MKRVLKSRIFIFMLGLVIAGSIGVYAASQIAASNITYKNTTVDQALDDLYSKASNPIYDIIVSTSDYYTTMQDCSNVYVVITRLSPPVFKRNNIDISPIKTVTNPNNDYYTYTYNVKNVEKNENWEFKGNAQLFLIK